MKSFNGGAISLGDNRKVEQDPKLTVDQYSFVFKTILEIAPSGIETVVG